MKIEFHPGLNIITGETGAGKSLVVNALKYLAGTRFPREMIRTSTEKTIIESQLKYNNNNICLKRIFNRSGKSRAYLNDEPVKVDIIKSQFKKILDIHSQHEHQKLLNNDYHLFFLDSFAGNASFLSSTRSLYDSLIRELENLDRLKVTNRKLKEKLELYNFQIDELSQYPIEIGDDVKFDNTYRKLTNAASIMDSVEKIIHLIENNETSIRNNLSSVEKEMENLVVHDPDLQDIRNRLNSLYIEIDDISNELRNYQSTVFVDDQKIVEISDRLGFINTISRKYGGSLKRAIDYYNHIQNKIKQNHTIDNDIQLLERKINNIRQDYMESAIELSENRRKSAKLYQNAVHQVLSEMGMEKTRFKIVLTRLPFDKITEYGIDNCKFFISTNTGEEYRPFERIVSGGETSRFMLAVKMVMKNISETPTMVFDEVDTGISGKTADKIGNIIEAMSREQQIICITHLPQIAAKGNHHFRVFKYEKNNRTFSKVEYLDSNSRLLELAELISGNDISDTGIKQAKLLLQGSDG